jgi:hypothetical protein
MRKTQAEERMPVGLTVEEVQKVLHYFAKSPFIFQAAAAAHPLALEETLLYLAGHATVFIDKDSGVSGPLNELSKRTDLPESVLLKMSKNKHFPKEKFLCGGKLPVSLASELIKIFIGNHTMLNEIFRSDNIPSKALQEFVGELDFSFVQIISRHYPNFDEDLLDAILERFDMDEKNSDDKEETKRHVVYFSIISDIKLRMEKKFQMRILRDIENFPEKFHLKFAMRKDLSSETVLLLAKKSEGVLEILLGNKNITDQLKKELRKM